MVLHALVCTGDLSIALFGRCASKTEETTPQKRLTLARFLYKRSRFSSSESNPVTYQTGSNISILLSPSTEMGYFDPFSSTFEASVLGLSGLFGQFQKGCSRKLVASLCGAYEDESSTSLLVAVVGLMPVIGCKTDSNSRQHGSDTRGMGQPGPSQ
jgi:hypothetical protein